MPTPADLTRPEWINSAHPDDEGTAIYWLLDQNNKYEQLYRPGRHTRACRGHGERVEYHEPMEG